LYSKLQFDKLSITSPIKDNYSWKPWISASLHVLGKTGLLVGRLGVAASYGAPPTSFEEEKMNYGEKRISFDSGRTIWIKD
jgi:hypothetical protein